MSKEITPYNSQEKDKKQQVEDMFDSIAPTYDKLNRILSLRIDTIWRKNVIKLLKKQQPKTILDIATGTADLAIAMKEVQPSKIVGLDLSEEMLQVGRKKINNKQLDTLIEMVKGDSENLQFKDQSFDAITCAFGVRNFGNLQAGLKEMCRVVKDNGQVIILEFSKPKNTFFQKIYYFYFFNVLPFVGNLLSGDNRAYTYLPESVNAFPSGEAFANELKQAGFKSILCKPQTFGICTIYQAKK